MSEEVFGAGEWYEPRREVAAATPLQDWSGGIKRLYATRD